MIHSLGLCSVVMHINSESVLFLRVSSVEDWRGPLNGPRVSPNWTEPAASATWSSLVSVVPTKNGTVLTLPPITACRNSAVSWYSTSKPLCCEWDSSPKMKILSSFAHPQVVPFTFMHLADAFIQSDLHCIQVTVLHFISSCFPWESNPCSWRC